MKYILPLSLAQLPYDLLRTREGPLLGPIIQNEDDIEAIRCQFLTTSYEEGHRFMSPILYNVTLSEDQPTYIPVAVDEGSLLSDRVLVMDAGTEIFIWSGIGTFPPRRRTASTPPEESYLPFEKVRNHCELYASQVAASRYPRPFVLSFKEGSSQERWLLCRLISPATRAKWVTSCYL
eukprot:TRINITY_DN3958_c0_g1_i2.p1 TRINITY_DN3958_c0_g1~~TRINITY_DN3958_c0_g1_i2.p1  ORF type:complete len:178 (+),score=32.56 TRINITY_DN3958_c0_g1_i2:747-1280(+)